MAINTWITVTLDPSASGSGPKADRKTHINSGGFATADGANVTLAFDSAVITTQSKLLSCLDFALAQAAARLPP